MNKRRNRNELKHVHRFTDRHGKVRRYYRPDQRSKGIPLTADPVTEPALYAQQYHQAASGQPIAQIGEQRRSPLGSLNAVIASWKASDHFRGLSDNTRRAYASQIKFLQDNAGADPAKALIRATVRELVAIRRGQQKSINDLRNVLRAIVKHGLSEMDPPAFDSDPTLGLKKDPPKGKGARPWSDAEIDRWRDVYAVGTMARLAFEIAYTFGMRRSDVILLGPWNRNSGGLKRTADGLLRLVDFRQHKTDGAARSPVHNPDLLACLAALPADHFTDSPVDLDGNPTRPYLREASGVDYTVDHYGYQWRLWAEAAGLPNDFQTHGARKTMVTDAYDSGAAPDDAMNITGHADASVFKHYGAGRDRELAADRAATLIWAKRQQRRAG